MRSPSTSAASVHSAAKYLLLLPLVVFAAMINGCSDPCSIPMPGSANIRILNAMADVPTITILINDRLVYQNLGYTEEKWYTNVFDDKTKLPIGAGNRLVVLDPNSDTLLAEQVSLKESRQTLIITGRARTRAGHTAVPPRLIQLDDGLRANEPGKNIVRFVHAMPDLGAIDVYFKGEAIGNPTLNMNYAQVTPYIDTISFEGLTVTEAGNPNKIVIQIEDPIPDLGYPLTVVIRGSLDPHGTEPLPSPVVLNDDPTGLGTTLFSITSIFIRFVNGGRDSSLSLVTQGRIDQSPRTDVNGQDSVLCIAPQRSSPYWSITHGFHGIAKWLFSPTCPPMGELHYSYDFRDTLQDLRRYSIVAMQTNRLSDPTAIRSHMRVIDSMTSPKNPTHGRVRFINLSPDADVAVTKADQSEVVLTQGQILYEDYPIGQKTFTSNGRQYTFTVSADDPKTVWFTAATQSNPLPYIVTQD